MSTVASFLQTAVQLHQAGQLDQAAAMYRQILASDPRHLDALHLLGLVELAQGKLATAIEHIKAAIAVSPELAPLHMNLGSAYHAAGNTAQAIACFREGLRLDPNSAHAWNELGNLLRADKQPIEAEECYRQAIKIDFLMAEGYNNLGNVLQEQGRLEEALEAYQSAARYGPRLSEVHYNLGNCHKALKQLTQAAAAYRQAIAIHPALASAHHNLGTVLYAEKKYAEAADCHREALRLKPDYLESLNALGAALQMTQRVDEAIALYRRALELNPQDSTAHFNMASALELQHDYRGAKEHFLTVLKLRGEHFDTLSGLANVTLFDADVETAKAYNARALAVSPDNPGAHFFRGSLLLMQGNMKEGWGEFDHRLEASHLVHRSFAEPRWDGSPLSEKTLLVYSEYGFGDSIQFIRYEPLVRERVKNVIFEVQGALIPLLEQAGLTALVPAHCPLQPFDVQIPLMGLPGVFQTTLETIPARRAYLFAGPQRVAVWRERLKSIEGLKIGIHWQGNTDYTNDCHRSIPLSQFAPLAQIGGVKLISLQKGPGSEQIAKVADQVPVIAFDNLDAQVGAFIDSAAMIQNLDLVITSDSAIAHLAGALGAKVWLALTLVPDWRWLLEREDSPWYPTMRLYRQQRLDDWGDVFQRMASDLRRFVEEKGRA